MPLLIIKDANSPLRPPNNEGGKPRMKSIPRLHENSIEDVDQYEAINDDLDIWP